jgi:hypothetical protein
MVNHLTYPTLIYLPLCARLMSSYLPYPAALAASTMPLMI